MLPTGLKDNQLRESNSQKVHPQPMEESINQNPEAVEALISKIFTNISSLKSAYIQLQSAHTPYDPEKIQAADKLVISELKNLSELKHFYRENYPKPVCVSPQDSRLAAEIQEQQSLLKTYEVMVKKFQSEIQNKDAEILQLQQQIEEATQKRGKLEKNLKLRGLSTKESEGSGDENGFFPVDLTPELFIFAVEAAFKAIHDFSKPLINMMKAAGWDLDAAANSIEPDVFMRRELTKRASTWQWFIQRWKRHSLEIWISEIMLREGSEFSEVYMESVVKNLIMDENQKPIVGLMVMLVLDRRHCDSEPRLSLRCEGC
ncbi:hypothetical protein GH714_043790 [Hevea brasiliensis]|uniref:DUF641 domain-containing protein n=1 Tax=Hevea brasiliensis TaxID=3981 RepID=A0A6A6K1N1_HEVBR|nr:hypothetical protein GH714_043790 [Hevea brasiliensis]